MDMPLRLLDSDADYFNKFNHVDNTSKRLLSPAYLQQCQRIPSCSLLIYFNVSRG